MGQEIEMRELLEATSHVKLLLFAVWFSWKQVRVQHIQCCIGVELFHISLFTYSI